MNILSLRESDIVAREADALCRVVGQHAEPLRAATLGRKVRLEGVNFRLVQKDRNALYRVSGKIDWFLKLPTNDGRDVITHEIAGAKAVGVALASYWGYQHAAAIRASKDGMYVLYAAVDGKQLNRILYRGCLNPSNRISEATRITFGNLGETLAYLHQYTGGTETLLANRDSANTLRNDLEKVSQPDPLVQKIERWVDHHAVSHEEPAWVHANMKFENVLAHQGRVCIIDFENCGKGSRYEDLSGPCCHCVLLQTLPIFPWRRALQAMASMLNGYKKHGNYDREVLMDYIARRVCHYYVAAIALGDGPARIAGIPVVRSKLERLVFKMISSEADKVFVGAL